ncbi:MAG: metalloregulator ArsR/SmtB family transcription factor [Methanobacterium sp.]|nr:metalloregulator ArsR/SmtB family transcription factor [Methanobacterium sp.]
MLKVNTQRCSNISEELEELFKALGNINRLLLVYRLASGEMEKVSVTDMARIMGLTQPAASQHLKILKTAKILHAQKQGNYIYYTFNESALVEHKEKIDFLFGCLLLKCERIEPRHREEYKR